MPEVPHQGPELLRCHIAGKASYVDGLWPLLSDSEQRRAQRYVNRDDALRYIVGHARLREWLGRQLHVAPRALRFGAGPHGKPALEGFSQAPHFNLSHSGDWVLIAVHRSSPVGVDVEAVRPQMARIDDFRGVLAPDEQAWLDALPGHERARAFARTWVRKEAYIKAIGEGMSRDLKCIAIVDAPSQAPRLLYDLNPESALSRWRLVDLELDDDHVGCLAYRENA